MAAPHAAITTQRGSTRRRSTVLPALIAGAWLLILLSYATGGAAALHHHALIEGGPPLWVAVPFFLAGWLVMVAAMMLPASLSTVRLVETAAVARGRVVFARVAFLGPFALIWAAFGSLAFLGDVGLHHLVDATPWLAARPWLIEAAPFAVAGGYQFLPLKRRSLAACRHPGDLRPWISRTDAAVARFGLRHGLACLGSSWALMLLMFAEGFASLWWMVILTTVMVYEGNGRLGQRATAGVGIALILAALIVLSGRPGPTL